MNNIKSIDKDMIHASDSDLVNIDLLGSSKYQYVINSKINFILKTERFSGQLFWNWTMSVTQIYELIFNYFSF